MNFTIDTINTLDTNKIGFFRFKKLPNASIIITNDAGKFHFFSDKDFKNFLSGDVEKLSNYSDLVKKGFIKDTGYQEKLVGSVAMKNHFVGIGPTLHMVVTTLRCNHKCKYCHAAVAPMSAKQFDMDEDTARKVVDAILHTNSQSLTIEFQGGESLVNYPIVQFITEYATTRAQHLQKQLSFSIVTNLTLMSEEKLSWLLDHQVDICTSLDGDELSHNNNRTGYEGNSFEMVSYWIKRVSEEKQKRGMGKIGALLTVTKETLPRYREIIDAYIDLDLDSIFLRWLNPYGFAASDLRTLAYKDDEWIDFYKKSLDYIIELNKKGIKFKESMTMVYLMKIFSSIDPGYMDIRSPSGIAIGGVAYNYDGKVYASDESRMLGRMGIEDFFMTELQETGKDTYGAMMNSDITKIAVQSSCLDGLPGYNEHAYKPFVGVDIIHNFKTKGNIYYPYKKDNKFYLQEAILDYIFEKLQNPETEKILLDWLQ
ncbi:His-Xaa-Ser system radical SAM maturase HxsB [Candidatus Gracilibacteria bacterium]|nr:His-Xaa-Ser system radical SAM maturase HxsB [Candidatus Gracilibacteria bacterium]